jgi:glycyl-tRNA synthetase beta subunit
MFNTLESVYKKDEQSITDFEQKLNSIKQLKKGSELEPLVVMMEKLIEISKSANHNYLIFLYMIEALAFGTTEESKSSTYDEKQMLTDKDRNALDWIHRYMEHSKGENSGQ